MPRAAPNAKRLCMLIQTISKLFSSDYIRMSRLYQTFLCLSALVLARDLVHAQDYLAFANRFFINRLEFGSFSLQTLYTDTSENFIAFDYDYQRGYFYWTDTALFAVSSIYRSDMQGGDVTSIISMTLDVPDGLAIDWLTNKLYWSEATHETISVLDLESGFKRRLFSLPESSIPRGIALDPVNGYMFWTDWGTPGKIERAYMDGSGRVTLADSSLVWPSDITIDFDAQLIYWVDASLDKIERSGYDGSNRQIVLSSAVYHPFSITLYSGTLYWTDWQTNAIHSKAPDSSSGTIVFSGLTLDPMGIEAVTPLRQTIVETPCDGNNGNCEQLCLLGMGRTATCECIDGYVISSDGRSCTRVEEYLAFANRQYIQRLELDSFTLRTLHTDVHQNFIAFDFDYRRDAMYWTDVQNGFIRRGNLDGTRVPMSNIVEGLQVPDGLAVDWVTNKLYWSEATPETISVLDIDRGHRRILFTLPESSVPRGIALDPANGLMFWTDWGSPGKIERAYMDGSGRITLADTSLVWPNDITIDYDNQLLYWVDANLDKIESANYDGSNRQTVASSGVFHPFSVTFFEDTLYWTDWTANAVYMKADSSSSFTAVYDRLLTEPMGIEAVSTSRQGIVSTPCDTNNGDCEHLCLLSVGRTATCVCAQGYTLDADGRNCNPITTESPPTPTVPAPFGSCRDAGFTHCCHGGDCQGVPRTCYCDHTCVILQDCCDDFAEICSAYTCDSLPLITNGAVGYSLPADSNRYDIGTIATYSCTQGFYLLGTATRTCTQSGTNGVWDGDEPQCFVISCSSLPSPADGSVSYSPDTTPPFEFETVVTYSCNAGFGLFGGNRTRECTSSGLGGGGWSGNAPTCGPIACPFLLPPQNGRVTFSTDEPYRVEVTAISTCNEGFTLMGSMVRTCGGDGLSIIGVWSGVTATCVAVTCSALTTPTNGMILFSPPSSAPYAFGTMASYSCMIGYGLSGGDATRTCDEDSSSTTGVWSGAAPTCEVITCTALTPVSNGAIVYGPDTSSPFSFGTMATYSCNDGFYLAGGSPRTCSGDGSSRVGVWSGTTPQCAHIMCPSLSPPDNGLITYSEESSSSFRFMETATYSCSAGYGLSGGDSVRTCIGAAGSSGEWSGSAPTCQVVMCSTLTPPTNGQVVFSTDMTAPYDYGTVATFSCDVGFGPSALTRTCEGGGDNLIGTWSGTAIICTAYTCALLPSIPNGVITYSPDTSSPFAFGTAATYACNDGYYLSGTSFRTCSGSGSQSEGFWLGTEPQCLAITCTSPSVPLNGLVSYDPDTTSPYNYQTTATYSCSEGYSLSGGDSSRLCVSANPGDGGWSGMAPRCEAIVCLALSSPTNGGVTYSAVAPFTYGVMATYSCNQGFGMKGGDVMRTCGGDGSSVNGMWSGVAPTCQAITCLVLTAPNDGMIMFASSAPYSFGTTASYSCVSGYGLSGGDATRTCGGDSSSTTGMWSGGAPTCEGIVCSSLDPIPNGRISYNLETPAPYDFGTVATYSCSEGFFMQGDNIQVCAGDGTSVEGMWSGSPPVCAAVMCPSLSPPNNGLITYSEESSSSFGFMETATYSCSAGYGLSGGDSVRTCIGAAGSSGEWSGSAPTCQVIMCTPLSQPSNGQLSYSTDVNSPFEYGTVATYSCIVGHGLMGDMTRTCGGDGSSPDGVWSGTAPSCDLFMCTSLPPIPNGVITYDPDITSPYIFGTTALYSCNDGFYLSQSSDRTCTGSGSTSFWDGNAPECFAFVCASIDAPLNGYISYGPDTTSPFDYQTTATYICNEGYGLSAGDSSRQCEGSLMSTDGVWSGTAPTCETIICPAPPVPANGKTSLSTSGPLTYGTTALYFCNRGYGISGGDMAVTCRGDGSSTVGEWSGDIPTCSAITCPALTSIVNGDITYSRGSGGQFAFSTTATYSCNEGFLLEGSTTRTCDGDGSSVIGIWSGSNAVCRAFSCGTLPAPANGTVAFIENSNGFAKTAEYSCNPGYALVDGDKVRTCVGIAGRTTGNWDGTAPICEVLKVNEPLPLATQVGAGVAIPIVLIAAVFVLLPVGIVIFRRRCRKNDFDPQLFDDVLPVDFEKPVTSVENPVFDLDEKTSAQLIINGPY